MFTQRAISSSQFVAFSKRLSVEVVIFHNFEIAWQIKHYTHTHGFSVVMFSQLVCSYKALNIEYEQHTYTQMKHMKGKME